MAAASLERSIDLILKFRYKLAATKQKTRSIKVKLSFIGILNGYEGSLCTAANRISTCLWPYGSKTRNAIAQSIGHIRILEIELEQAWN